MVALLILLLLALAVAGGYYALLVSGFLEPKITTVEVPDLLGMSLTEARDICEEYELVLNTDEVTYELTENTEKGKIIDVDPEIGTEVEKQSKINVAVSSGIGVYISDYTGQKVSDAVASLAEKHPNVQVELVSEETAEEDEIIPGTVLRQELLAPHTQINRDVAAQIRLVYAAYPTITIPEDIEGTAIDEAVAALEEMGAVVYTSDLDTTGMTEEQIAALPTGIVIKIDPDPGSDYTQTDENFITIYYYGY